MDELLTFELANAEFTPWIVTTQPVGRLEKFVQNEIYGDTVCDMNAAMREQYGIEYVKMNYCFDGKEYPASLDWESHSAKEFYDLMRAGTVVTTTQVPRHVFEEEFEKCCKEGKDVVYVDTDSIKYSNADHIEKFNLANEENHNAY